MDVLSNNKIIWIINPIFVIIEEECVLKSKNAIIAIVLSAALIASAAFVLTRPQGSADFTATIQDALEEM